MACYNHYPCYSLSCTLCRMVTTERKRQPTPIKDLDRGLCDEEDWNIKDCIVVEDGKAANPVGRVIKIDGSFAAVKFSNTSDPVDDPLHNVRLLRKEDLQVRRES